MDTLVWIVYKILNNCKQVLNVMTIWNAPFGSEIWARINPSEASISFSYEWINLFIYLFCFTVVVKLFRDIRFVIELLKMIVPFIFVGFSYKL